MDTGSVWRAVWSSTIIFMVGVTNQINDQVSDCWWLDHKADYENNRWVTIKLVQGEKKLTDLDPADDVVRMGDSGNQLESCVIPWQGEPQLFIHMNTIRNTLKETLSIQRLWKLVKLQNMANKDRWAVGWKLCSVKFCYVRAVITNMSSRGKEITTHTVKANSALKRRDDIWRQIRLHESITVLSHYTQYSAKTRCVTALKRERLQVSRHSSLQRILNIKRKETWKN